MAASGKKKKGKGKAISLNEFLATSGSSGGPAKYEAPGKQSRDSYGGGRDSSYGGGRDSSYGGGRDSAFGGGRDTYGSSKEATISWAEEMDSELLDDPDADLSGCKLNMDRSILPTAPRAARGPDIDMTKVPDVPPFTCFLGNLPYDVDEDDIEKFFREAKLDVVNVRLPQDGGRLKGFGYAEFPDKATLIEALAMNEGQLRNRKIRIDLAGSSQEGGGRGTDRDGRPRRDDDGEDKTDCDWRRAPRTDDGPSGGGSSSFGGRRDDSFGGDRDRGSAFGGGGRDRDRGGFGDRDRGFGGDRDRDRGFGGGDRDGGRRGFGGGFSRDREGGGGGGSSFGGDRDRGSGFGGERRRYSPPRDRGSFGGDRDRGSYGGGGGGGSPPREGPPRERPKLQLAPRSKPAESGGARSSIFGDAKPVDTQKYEEMSRTDRLKDEKGPAPSTRYQPPSDSRRDNRDNPRDGDRRSNDDEREAAPRYQPPRDDHRDDRRDDKPRDDHSDEAANRPTGERPRLNLQKRTKPLEEGNNKDQKTAGIFGAAKPVDTTAREREIEQRLQREKEMEQQELLEKETTRDRRLSSSDQRSTRLRKDSNNSNEGDKRTRKLSSSSSGKGIRTIAPPTGSGSARIRRDSTLSDHEDNVFDEVHGSSPNSKQPKSPSVTSDDPPAKLVPAPPPKENIWEKRKAQATSPPSAAKPESAPSQPPPPERRPSQDDNTKDKENVVPVPAPSENAWKKGKPDLVPAAAAPKENVWEKRKQETKTQSPPKSGGSLPSDNAWSRGKPRADAPPPARGGRGQGDSKPRQRPEKQLPQSIDEMPKAEDLEVAKKDIADSNKFAMLLDDEEGGNTSD